MFWDFLASVFMIHDKIMQFLYSYRPMRMPSFVFRGHSMHRVPCFHVSGSFWITFQCWNLHVCMPYSMPCHVLLEWHLCLRIGPRFACMCARISSVSFFILWPLMWVWLRSTHVSVSPLCIVYAISFHSIAYARLYVSALCMPCCLVHRVCHFIALCMLGCMLVALCVPSHLHCVWDRS